MTDVEIVKQLIASGRTKEAIETFTPSLDAKYYNIIILLSSRFQTNEINRTLKGILSLEGCGSNLM